MRRRKRMLEDLDQDIRDHIERETQDNIERGVPPEEARLCGATEVRQCYTGHRMSPARQFR